MDFEKRDSSSKDGVDRRVFSNGSWPDEGLFQPVPAKEFGQTHRGLKSRHIQFLALGTYFLLFCIELILILKTRWMYWHWIVCGVWPSVVACWTCSFAHVLYCHVFDYLGRHEQSRGDDHIYADWWGLCTVFCKAVLRAKSCVRRR